ncbi:pyridoxal-phosphate dependent enzyme [Streptomyces thinghirensis]|nr:pyridoxal-phosphate dependent enzyme [Streptomyces thinghirensis]
MRYDSITEAIGNTPLVRIDPAVHGLRNIDLYAKLEMLNPFGSVKDRPAWHMARPPPGGRGRGGGTVVELSSGTRPRRSPCWRACTECGSRASPTGCACRRSRSCSCSWAPRSRSCRGAASASTRPTRTIR